MAELTENIPRIYTAIAEWLAATIYIVCLRPKIEKSKIAALAVLWLMLQGTLLIFTKNAPIYLWIPVMMMAVGSIFVYIKVTCDLPNMDIGFVTARVFVLAEFAASFAWQIYSYFLGFTQKPSLALLLVVFILIYGAVFTLDYLIEIRKLPSDRGIGITKSELISTIVIAATIFSVSNLSFININVPFRGNDLQEIFYIRTLVDFCGVLLLFSQQDERQKRRLSYEKDAMDEMLKRQYEQYKMSRDNIAFLNMKYHDLKHQIIAIREENNEEKREQYLQEMEDRIKMYEAEFQTGSHVLDILLTTKSEYCRIHEIDFTCMADGTLVQFMDKMDLCTLFGNALDNAIESALKQKNPEKRLIRSALYSKGQFVMLRFENYSDAIIDSKKGLPVTTKKDKGTHGIGLRSIELIAQKYNGTMTINTENHWFVLRILFPVNEKPAY